MSRFREIYSTERFAQVLAINTAFLDRSDEVEHVSLFTAPADWADAGESIAVNQARGQGTDIRIVTPVQ